MAVEIVIMAPVLVAFMLFVVALGRMVWIRGELESAARDAVRAASLERNAAAGENAADAVVDQQVGGTTECPVGELSGDFAAGGTITYSMVCIVDFEDLGLIGLPGSTEFTFSSDAPLDEFRRTD
jgi:hypothetical protein